MKRLSAVFNYSAFQALAIAMALLLAQPALAEPHVVPLLELHDAALASEQSRAGDRSDIDRFLSNEKVKQVMTKGNIDASQVRLAVATLSDQDISNLAAKARSLEADIAAGNLELSDAQVTILLLGFFAIVLVMILVLAFK